ncbi:MAG: triose-phosphate isomerase [Syntrophales bacterium]|nr:triose-phosphate isomerase [Syntrophales bacterium]
MRTALIVGNWKMHKTIGEAVAFARSLRVSLVVPPGREAVVAPPFTALAAVAGVLRGTDIGVAAQDCHDRREGAYTGEVSPWMLADAGCRYVIVGHSERRRLFGETDRTVRSKITAVLEARLSPIVCIGETLEEREKGITLDVVARQLTEALQNCGADDMKVVVIAYEPVWAIGTGKTATPTQAQEVHRFIRSLLEDRYGHTRGAAMRILYGGSVTPANMAGLMAEADIDGALVGGASLDVESFVKIVKYQ